MCFDTRSAAVYSQHVAETKYRRPGSRKGYRIQNCITVLAIMVECPSRAVVLARVKLPHVE